MIRQKAYDHRPQLQMIFKVVRKYVDQPNQLLRRLIRLDANQLRDVIDECQAHKLEPQQLVIYFAERFELPLKMLKEPRVPAQIHDNAWQRLEHPPFYGRTAKEAMEPDFRVGRMEPCSSERKRVAFPKLHKVAGDTMMSILHRFGYERNLTFLLPKPFLLTCTYPWNLYPRTNYAFAHRENYDILTYHTVYDSQKFSLLMPKDAVYLAILREPFSHFRSVWDFHNMKHRFGISSNGTDAVITFLQNPEDFDAHFYVENKSCRGKIPPVSLTRSPLAVDLGLPLELATYYRKDDSYKKTITDMFIEKIESEFPLVMIMEHFDESLVLFKRLMCWNHKDIIYISRNVGKTTHDDEKDIPDDLKQVHRQWSYVDYALYEHFYGVLQRKLSDGGQDLTDEIEHFKKINLQVIDFCEALERWSCDVGEKLEIPKSKWDPGFSVDRDFCLVFRRELKCDYVIAAERRARAHNLEHSIKKHLEIVSDKEHKATIQRHCIYCERTQNGMCRSIDYLNYLATDEIISKETLKELRTEYYPKSYNLHCKGKEN
ncbi:PREDICTED: galactose-3-O-sulfotransferase 3-like [Branchiostoma belcheri]|uniref:Galactose-3-O-sulfotransferase 3-like n=1 Tax=Branchiostoma belcheri TaxID=7741 RepID=A0A6P4ZHU6_BRABE|nr:PREDICTED: galactose-3-O-sulfotransferase 3-like [Branchiostoma belcheri]